MKVLLIIPAYNEEESIVQTIKSINKYKENKKNDFQLDYVVINDGSTDKTPQLLEEKHINHVDLIMNLGIGGAVQTGYKYALIHDYDIAIQFDGDGQHDINSIDNVLNPIINEGFDFCVGSRFVKGSTSEFQTTGMRRFGIKLISFLIAIVTGKRVFDVTSGYRAANKNVITYFAKRYPTEFPEPESIVQLLKKKYKVTERPVNMMERIGGVSSIHTLKSVKYMIEVSTAVLVSAFMKEED